MSEQDFFFEEPEQAPKAPKSERQAKPSGPAKGGNAPAKSSAAPVTEPAAEQSTTWSVAILLALVGLLLGAILGFMLGGALAKPAATVAGGTGTSATSGGSGVPGELTTEQIGAGLPPGHPTIDTSSTETTGQ